MKDIKQLTIKDLNDLLLIPTILFVSQKRITPNVDIPYDFDVNFTGAMEYEHHYDAKLDLWLKGSGVITETDTEPKQKPSVSIPGLRGYIEIKGIVDLAGFKLDIDQHIDFI